MRTRLEFRARIATDTRETQINTTIEEYLNQTLAEINDPAWAFEQVSPMRGYNHLWSFNRRKTSLNVSGESTQLPRDLDKIGLVRQTTTPVKLRFIPDDLFYDYIPDPTSTGNPKWYRIWEEEGVSTRLSTDDMVEVLSDSASDTSATVRIVGYDTNGLLRTESLTLTGITAVSGTITYDSGKILKVSKSADTTGIITIREKTADTTLVKLAPTERAGKFKVISFYPIPPSTTGTITAFADYSATVTGTVKVTDATHGLSTGNTITISGTTNYNGNYSITKIDDDSFYITATWVATETGAWAVYTTIYLEYFTRIRRLEGDNDVPDIDEKWFWVVRLGTMAKVYQYQGKESLFNTTQALYGAGVRSMVKSDMGNVDYIPYLRSQFDSLGSRDILDLVSLPLG